MVESTVSMPGIPWLLLFLFGLAGNGLDLVIQCCAFGLLQHDDNKRQQSEETLSTHNNQPAFGSLSHQFAQSMNSTDSRELQSSQHVAGMVQVTAPCKERPSLPLLVSYISDCLEWSLEAQAKSTTGRRTV